MKITSKILALAVTTGMFALPASASTVPLELAQQLVDAKNKKKLKTKKRAKSKKLVKVQGTIAKTKAAYVVAVAPDGQLFRVPVAPTGAFVLSVPERERYAFFFESKPGKRVGSLTAPVSKQKGGTTTMINVSNVQHNTMNLGAISVAANNTFVPATNPLAQSDWDGDGNYDFLDEDDDGDNQPDDLDFDDDNDGVADLEQDADELDDVAADEIDVDEDGDYGDEEEDVALDDEGVDDDGVEDDEGDEGE